MNCPKCNYKNNSVTRTGKGLRVIIRERYCPECDTYFHTIEKYFSDDILANDLINKYKSNTTNNTEN